MKKNIVLFLVFVSIAAISAFSQRNNSAVGATRCPVDSCCVAIGRACPMDTCYCRNCQYCPFDSARCINVNRNVCDNSCPRFSQSAKCGINNYNRRPARTRCRNNNGRCYGSGVSCWDNCLRWWASWLERASRTQSSAAWASAKEVGFFVIQIIKTMRLNFINFSSPNGGFFVTLRKIFL